MSTQHRSPEDACGRASGAACSPTAAVAQRTKKVRSRHSLSAPRALAQNAALQEPATTSTPPPSALSAWDHFLSARRWLRNAPPAARCKASVLAGASWPYAANSALSGIFRTCPTLGRAIGHVRRSLRCVRHDHPGQHRCAASSTEICDSPDLPPNPSLQRTPPGRSPGRCR